MKYVYYPGCSLRGTGRAYEESLLTLFGQLGVRLEELDDWNCCGATNYVSVDEMKAYALAGRNLARAARQQGDLLAPCSACYMALLKTQRYMAEDPETKRIVGAALAAAGLDPPNGVRIRHPLDVLLNDVGLDAIRARVVRPLKGLKVIPYYGCQVVRPYATFDDQHDPTSMDRLLEAAGATVIDFHLKTRCCGGSQKGTMPEIGLYLIHTLLSEAGRDGGDVIATVCPLCQFNLEVFQREATAEHRTPSIPVVYFTQLLALALGATPDEAALDRLIVPFALPAAPEKEPAHV